MHTGLRCSVGAHAARRLHCSHRADVDDASRARRDQVRNSGARGIHRSHYVDGVEPLPCLRIAFGNGLKRKRSGDIDERIEPSEMRCRRADGLCGLCGIGQVDAAKFEPLGGRARRCRGMIDASHPGAARDGGACDHLAQRAGRAGDDDDFSVHKRSPETNGCNRAISLSARSSIAQYPGRRVGAHVEGVLQGSFRTERCGWPQCDVHARRQDARRQFGVCAYRYL